MSENERARDFVPRYRKVDTKLIYPCRFDKVQFAKFRELIKLISCAEWLRIEVDKRGVKMKDKYYIVHEYDVEVETRSLIFGIVEKHILPYQDVIKKLTKEQVKQILKVLKNGK